MSTTIHRLLTPLACAAALCLPAHAATVSASAPAVATTVGGTTTLTIALDLSAPIELWGITLNLDWPAAGLSFNPLTSTALGGSWLAFVAGFDMDFSSVSSAPGSFGASAILLAPMNLPAGNSTLGLSFSGLAEGSHAVNYSVELADLSDTPPFAQGVSAVAVSAIPEPSPAALLAAGIAALSLLARRKLH